MNKVIVVVGTVVLSATFVQAQYSPGLSPLETSKPWSVAVSLRGFYDDNYLTLPKNYPVSDGVVAHPLASWGTEIIPQAAMNHSVENTLITASYMYDLQWYENHSMHDESHQFKGRLEHEFSERYKLSINESFVIAQEPTFIDPDIITSPLRVNGDNVRNTGQVDFTDSLTKNLDLHLEYGNTVYAYQQTARSVVGYPFYGVYSNYYSAVPSYSAQLDRMEQMATVDLRWKATPETTGILGYQFGHTGYTSPEWVIYPNQYSENPNNTAGGYYSSSRNSDSHYVFVGADETFTPNLAGSARAGMEYLDYYNYDSSRLSPYVDASLTYQYNPGCAVQIGVKHAHNSTDVVGSSGTTPVLDEESTAVYISDSHKLSDRLTAGVMGQAQLSSFVGGGSGFDGKMDDFYILQVNLAYQLNPWLMIEAGYNFSRLKSDLPDRSYVRDVMYMGVRAMY